MLRQLPPRACAMVCRGEIVESVPPPLPLGTPLLLVKPSMGLLTSSIFRAFDLSLASSADPRALMSRLCSSGMCQDVCINDLERPAFIKCANGESNAGGSHVCSHMTQCKPEDRGSKLPCVGAVQLIMCQNSTRASISRCWEVSLCSAGFTEAQA